MIAHIEKDFPNLVRTGYVKTSEATSVYNCVAFSLGDQAHWWWPPVYDEIACFWPDGLPWQETLATFVALYLSSGFESAANAALEAGWVKVALWVEPKEELFAHVCLQLPNGKWISKMGDNEDIMHTLEGLEGPPHHFRVAQIMRCRIDAAPSALRQLLAEFGST